MKLDFLPHKRHYGIECKCSPAMMLDILAQNALTCAFSGARVIEEERRGIAIRHTEGIIDSVSS